MGFTFIFIDMENKTSVFVLKSNNIHNGKYDYSKSHYVDSHTKVCIVCPVHGDFFIRPYSHTNGKQGCPKCGVKKRPQCKPKSLEMFILDCNCVHGTKYDYSKVKYRNNHIKIEIVCPEHGSFWMRPNSHLHGQGCPICGHNHHKSVSLYPYKTKICKSCGLEKSISEYYIDNEYYRGRCKECEKKVKVIYRKNPVNKNRFRKYIKYYRNNRRKLDPVYRLRVDIPTIIRRAIKKKYYNDTIWRYLPYTPEQLKEHLEKQFDDKMTWDNHGIYWHIDHIIPKAAFHYDSENHPDFLRCWALNNLRPLEAQTNMKKSSILNGKRIINKHT